MTAQTQTLVLAGTAAAFLAAAAGAVMLGPGWDALARRRVAQLMPELNSLGLNNERLPRYLRLWGLAMLAAAVGLGVFAEMPLMAAAAVYLLYVAPAFLLRSAIARRRTLLRDQLVGASIALSNACRAGLSLSQALESVAKETPAPLANELNRVVNDFNRGRPLAAALTDAKNRLKLDGFTLFASALLASIERGGRLTEALDRISRSLTENQRLERKLEADTASGRKVVVILAIFPALFLGMLCVMDPKGMGAVFAGGLGQIVLFGVGLLVYVAVRWARSILNVDI